MKRYSTTCKTTLLAGCAVLSSLMMGCPGNINPGGGVKPLPTTANLSVQGQKVQFILGSDTTGVALNVGRIALLDLSTQGSPALRQQKFIFAKQWAGLMDSGRLLKIKSSRFAATLDLKTLKLTVPRASLVVAGDAGSGSSGTLTTMREEAAFDLKDATFLAVAQNGNETVVMSCCDEPCEPMDIPTAISEARSPSSSWPPKLCGANVVTTDGNETIIILECNIIDPGLEGRLEQIYPGLGNLLNPGDPVAAQQGVPMSYLVPWDRLDLSRMGGKGGSLRDPNPPGQKSMAPADPKANARGSAMQWDHTCSVSESNYRVTICDNILTFRSADGRTVTEIDMNGCKVGLSSQDSVTTIHYNDDCAAQMRNLPCDPRN